MAEGVIPDTPAFVGEQLFPEIRRVFPIKLPRSNYQILMISVNFYHKMR
jgi:hypothetical protein